MSSLTHAHEISILGCYIYVHFMIALLKENDKYNAYIHIKEVDYSYFSEYALNKYKRVLKDTIYTYSLDTIKSSGYVVDTLEAVLWVVFNTDSYKDSIINAINLGNDTDTVGAITGSITGILCGYDEIPSEWLNTLLRREYIENMCDEFERLLNGSK